jgi:hypothetical protein
VLFFHPSRRSADTPVRRLLTLPIPAACVIGLLACGLLVTITKTEAAEPSTGTLTLKFGPGVYHFEKSDEHNDRPWLVGASWEFPSGWNVGGAHFRNSFSQPSQYLYVGKRWFPTALPDPVYVNLTGGIMVGYKRPYDNKIPFNHSRGFAPALLPALGYQFERSNVQVIPLGTAGVILTLGLDL